MAILAFAAASFGQGADRRLGSWSGTLEFSDGRAPVNLRIVEGGALLDLPDAELYGLPSRSAEREGQSLSLVFYLGSDELTLRLGAVGPDSSVMGGECSYLVGTGSADASFSMKRVDAATAASTAASEPYAAKGYDGAALPGELIVPAGVARPPLVILHAGLGVADRDGNTYMMPGRHDALGQLAEALRARGIASYRYDKRGAGEAAWLFATEEDRSIEAWIRDLEAIASGFRESGYYSGVWLFGLNDGAVVAAAAANGLSAGTPPAGLIVACASAEGQLDAYRKAVSRAPDDEKSEGEAIIAALLAGRRVDAPSDFYAAAFRPGFQPYLIEAFRRDLRTELARYAGPCLLVQGNMDMQATLADLLALRAARPDALAAMPARMNHVLKDVSQDVEDNRAAFADPSYPVSAELVDDIAAFVAGTFVGIP